MFTSRRLTVAAASAVALTVTGYAVAQAAGASTTPTTTNAASKAALGAAAPAGSLQRQHRFLTPTERAELRTAGHTTVVRHTRQHGDVTLTVQIGHITAVSPTAITVVSRGGYGGMYTLAPSTVVKEPRRSVGVSELRLRERVLVVATPDGPARRIVIRRSARAGASAAAQPTA